LDGLIIFITPIEALGQLFYLVEVDGVADDGDGLIVIGDPTPVVIFGTEVVDDGGTGDGEVAFVAMILGLGDGEGDVAVLGFAVADEVIKSEMGYPVGLNIGVELFGGLAPVNVRVIGDVRNGAGFFG
jgi:hypothetical protein